MDADVIKEMDRVLRKQGMEIRTDARVVGGKRQGEGVRIDIEHGGKVESLEGDCVLVSVGRRPSLTGVDAKALGIATGRRGEIAVDEQMRTNVPGVFAIGDVIGGKLLAHKAEEEGVVAAEVIAGKPARMHYRSIPSVVYTWPEVASVGLTEEEVKQSGREYRAGKFPFSANGRARTMGESAGLVKFIADAKTEIGRASVGKAGGGR